MQLDASTPATKLTTAEHRMVLAAYARAELLLQAGAPLREVLAQLTSAVETLGDGRTVASILVLDREGLLRNGASPNLPADYLDAIDRLRPDARVGTCAAAAATGEIVETPSFLDDQRWSELRHQPMALGFLGAWSLPIKNAKGRVLGTFGTYFREHRLPTPAERQAVPMLAQVAASAIELTAMA
jgi:GAF domain-containing protein